MIINLTVSNFRSIKDTQSISFEGLKDARLDASRAVKVDDKIKVVKTGAIIGPNGAGKSTMVRALESIRNIIVANEEEANPLKFLNGNSFAYGETKGKPSEICVEFLAQGTVFTYSIKADVNKIYEESLFEKSGKLRKMVFSRVWSDEKQQYKFRYGRIYRGSKARVSYKLAQNRSLLARCAQRGGENADIAYHWFLQTLDIKPAGFSAASEMFLANVLIEHPEWSKKVVEFLWSCDITDIKDIVIQDGHVMFIHSNIAQKYGGYFMSESLSLRRLSTIAASYFEAFICEKTMLFDDFGMMLHPYVVRHCAKLFEKCLGEKNSQLIIVDCNPTLLEDGLLRRDGIWLAEKTNQSCTHYFSIAEFKYAVNSQRQQANYMAGLYNALPLVSDFKFNG